MTGSLFEQTFLFNETEAITIFFYSDFTLTKTGFRLFWSIWDDEWNYTPLRNKH